MIMALVCGGLPFVTIGAGNKISVPVKGAGF